MIKISPHISLETSEINFSYIRSPGPGGQNVNKVSTGVQLRFNVKHSSSFPEAMHARILSVLNNKITLQGDLIIKATRFRTQERNRQDALDRLQALLVQASFVAKKRKKTKPSYASSERRLNTKKLHGKNKSLRQNKTRGDD